jgi:hypothetical protein
MLAIGERRDASCDAVVERALGMVRAELHFDA